MFRHATALALTSIALAACSGDGAANSQDALGDLAPSSDVVSTADATDATTLDALDAARTDSAADAPRDVAVDVPVSQDVQGTDVVSAMDVATDTPLADDVVTATDAPVDTVSTCPRCAAGFTCGPAGYCVSAEGVPAFGHVYLIVMENHSLSSIMGSASAPYINGLISSNVLATRYVTRASAVIHPSLPNYIAMTAGDTFGIDCDCSPASASLSARASCLTARTSSSCPQAAAHMGDRLDDVSVAWRAYAEDMGSACNTTDSGNYVARHVPFLYYNNVRTNSTRCALRVRDYRDFAADLTAGTYRFSMVSPNLCNDMHGNGILGIGDTCGGTNAVNNGDRWLAAQVPPILATRGFAAGGTDVLFIVWDEEDNSTGSEPLPLIVVSPLARGGARTAMAYDHYSLLATMLTGLGAARVGTAEALAAPVIADIWR